MSFHNTRTHKARKVHRCSGSYGIIKPGETYTRFTGVNEGDFYMKLTHKIMNASGQVAAK